MTTANITECPSCGLLEYFLDHKKGIVPGTGARLDCFHIRATLGTVEVPHLVHVALSTLLRAELLNGPERVTAHQVQEWLRVPQRQWRVGSLPWVLQHDYGVSSHGLATARILASAMGAVTEPGQAFYWMAAGSLMRRRLPS